MKRRMFLLPLIASVLLPGCNKAEVKDPNTIILADFESWGPSFQTIGLYNSFGKVSRNEDKQYVKSGNYSALLQPVGNYVTRSEPTVYWPLMSSVFDFAYNDLSYFQKVEADFFNSSNEDITVTVGFVSSIISFTSATFSSGGEFVLKAGEWNHVTYEPDISILAAEIALTNVAGLYFRFPNQNIRDIDEAKKIYVDDIKIINSPEKRIIKDLFVIKHNEICDFESIYMTSSMSVSNVAANQLSYEIIDEFTDDEGTLIKPSHGKGMLHILNRATAGRWVNWSMLRFSSSYLNKTDLKKIEGVETGIWAIRYEIRFANDGGVLQNAAGGNGQSGVFPEFVSTDGSRVYVPKDKYVKDKWFTVEVPLCKDITYYTDQHVTVDANLITNNQTFGWTIGNEEHDVDIFIDNIRLSRIG